MNELENLYQKLPQIEKKLGYFFGNRALLAVAFIHRSFANEHSEAAQYNERFEFLGDSILGMLMTDYVYHIFPELKEGELSFLRSRLVDANACVAYVHHLDISSYLLLGKGEKLNDGRGRDSILADLFEAIVAAIYLDGGFQAAQNFIFKNLDPIIQDIVQRPLKNSKALLQDLCQKTYHQAPKYEVTEQLGPDHSKVFRVVVIVDDQIVGKGEGTSKKEAQQVAATNALRHFENVSTVQKSQK